MTTEPDDKMHPEHAGEALLTMPDGETITLPILRDVYGGRFVDIRKMQPTTGICTFDDGFNSTASCISRITWIDGKKGILRYRGYDVAELANRGTFYDAAFLLLNGELPTPDEREEFRDEVTRHTMVKETILNFFKGFRADAHPMSMLCSVIAALSSFYSPCDDIKDPALRKKAAMRLVAKVPTLAAAAFCYSRGRPFVYPRNSLSYSENLLHMLFATPAEPYVVDPVFARALEKILVLHLDHEQNASTSTVRTAGSSQANPFACVAAGVSALWGPAHGGANEACLRMLLEISTVEGGVPRAIARAKDKGDPWRLSGVGHRVYGTLDPRARVLRGVAAELLEHCGRSDDPVLKVAVALERAVEEDEYFTSRNLHPNVDFFSGICLRAMGVPMDMFTVIFAVARCVGFAAQWLEMMTTMTATAAASESASASGGGPRGGAAAPRIARPRQVYVGDVARELPRSFAEEGGEGEEETRGEPKHEQQEQQEQKQQHQNPAAAVADGQH